MKRCCQGQWRCISLGWNAAWLLGLKKALCVHAGQKLLRLAAESNQHKANSRSSRQHAAGSMVSSKDRVKGNCNRQHVKGSRAESLSKAYLQQRRWMWQDHLATEALAAPTCAASPTHTHVYT